MIEEFINGAVQETAWELAGSFLEVPYPTNTRIEFNDDNYCLDFALDFPFVGEKTISITRTRFHNYPHPRFGRELQERFSQVIPSAYADFRARYDLQLLDRLFRSVYHSFNDGGAQRWVAGMHDRLRDQVMRYHRHNRANVRFFNFRDLEAEETFYFGRADPQIHPRRGAYPFPADYAVTTAQPVECYRQPEPSEELVITAREFVHSKLNEILSARESPNFFEDRVRRFYRIEAERQERERRARQNTFTMENMQEAIRLMERMNPRANRALWEGAFPPVDRMPEPDPQPRSRPTYMAWDLAGMRTVRPGVAEVWHTYERENREAEKKARKLLEEHLTKEQLECFKKNGYFYVIGNSTGRKYRIEKGRQMNVYLVDKQNRKVQGYCFVPVGNLAMGDVLLSQKISLELDEEAALKVANPFQ